MSTRVPKDFQMLSSDASAPLRNMLVSLNRFDKEEMEKKGEKEMKMKNHNYKNTKKNKNNKKNKNERRSV